MATRFIDDDGNEIEASEAIAQLQAQGKPVPYRWLRLIGAVPNPGADIESEED